MKRGRTRKGLVVGISSDRNAGTHAQVVEISQAEHNWVSLCKVPVVCQGCLPAVVVTGVVLHTERENVGRPSKKGQREGSWETSHLTGRMGTDKWTFVPWLMIRDHWQQLGFMTCNKFTSKPSNDADKDTRMFCASAYVTRPYGNICSGNERFYNAYKRIKKFMI